MEATVNLIGFDRLALRTSVSVPCGRLGPDDRTTVVPI
jgi:hypothetical protein